MKTQIIARIDAAVNAEWGCERDDINRLLVAAYYLGRERATREISDEFTAHLRKQRERAQNCRYRHMAEAVIGPETYIYSPDYAGDVTGTLFAGETTEL